MYPIVDVTGALSATSCLQHSEVRLRQGVVREFDCKQRYMLCIGRDPPQTDTHTHIYTYTHMHYVAALVQKKVWIPVHLLVYIKGDVLEKLK